MTAFLEQQFEQPKIWIFLYLSTRLDVREIQIEPLKCIQKRPQSYQDLKSLHNFSEDSLPKHFKISLPSSQKQKIILVRL